MEVALPRLLSAEDPEAWLADGWMAAPGEKRESKAVLPSVNEPPPAKRERDPAALAAAARATAALVVGARVESRFQASLNVKWKTYWFGGKIDRVNGDGTYNVRYDDGDYEQKVKRRFIRLWRAKKQVVTAPAAPSHHASHVSHHGSHAPPAAQRGGGMDFNDVSSEEEYDEEALFDLGYDDISALVTMDY